MSFCPNDCPSIDSVKAEEQDWRLDSPARQEDETPAPLPYETVTRAGYLSEVKNPECRSAIRIRDPLRRCEARYQSLAQRQTGTADLLFCSSARSIQELLSFLLRPKILKLFFIRSAASSPSGRQCLTCSPFKPASEHRTQNSACSGLVVLATTLVSDIATVDIAAMIHDQNPRIKIPGARKPSPDPPNSYAALNLKFCSISGTQEHAFGMKVDGVTKNGFDSIVKLRLGCEDSAKLEAGRLDAGNRGFFCNDGEVCLEQETTSQDCHDFLSWRTC
ncbi:hypothetical protein J6590_041129 [Homalodisca vitripennis]|nr:hypothetical protein J6590_041129 [Homalodisca vitripennis]